MKYVLIHANNTALIRSPLFPEQQQILFNQGINEEEDVDFYLQSFIQTYGNRINGANAIFIKFALTESYSELIGLRLGHYIRLSDELNKGRLLPIIFIGDENPIQILKLTYLGNIFASPGIYYASEDIELLKRIIERINKGELPGLKKLGDYLEKVEIRSPANYDSHHAIANEWSILRWAKTLGLKEKEGPLSTIKKTIGNLLYYKYLQAKNPIGTAPGVYKVRITDPVKILYIDDDWEKGWATVVGSLLNTLPTGSSFKTIELFYKKLPSSEEVIEKCKTDISNFDPDIVLLDLRLHDDDFKTGKKPKEFSGFQLLKFIKNINPGIQVIIFTASNKVWNLIELQDAGADDFILKESPEVNVDAGYTAEIIDRFIEAVEKASKKAFIKELVVKCEKIRKHLKTQHVEENPAYNRFIRQLKNQLEICLSALTLINLSRPVTLDIAFLSFYNFLEIFKDYYLKEDKKDRRYYLGYDKILLKRYFYENNKLIGEDFTETKTSTRETPSWRRLLIALFADYFQILRSPYTEMQQLERLQRQRNAYIHSTKTKFTKDELSLIVDISLKACSKMKE